MFHLVRKPRRCLLWSASLLLGLCGGLFPEAVIPHAHGQEEQPAEPRKASLDFPELVQQAIPLTQDKTLFLDQKSKALYLEAYVVLEAGLLEMLCCPAQTKEHESILATRCAPQLVHAGLLALKAEPGTPAQFSEQFQPPQGEKLEITLFWKDAQGKKQKQLARAWVRTATRRYFVTPLPQLPADLKFPDDSDLKYDPRLKELIHYGVLTPELQAEYNKFSADKAFQQAVQKLVDVSQPQQLEADWVFVGSQFIPDPESGKQRYLADAGDFICVANFPSAMIDIAEKSSASDEYRAYEANSDLVPTTGTPVFIKLQRLTDIPAEKPAPPNIPPSEPSPPSNNN